MALLLLVCPVISSSERGKLEAWNGIRIIQGISISKLETWNSISIIMLDCFSSLMNSAVQKLRCCERGDGTNQVGGTFDWVETMHWQNTNTKTNATTNTNTNTLEEIWKEDMFDWPRLIFGCLCCPPTTPPHNVKIEKIERLEILSKLLHYTLLPTNNTPS